MKTPEEENSIADFPFFFTSLSEIPVLDHMEALIRSNPKWRNSLRRGSGEGLAGPGANRFGMSWPTFRGGNTFENARNSKIVPIIILLVESGNIYSSICV